MCPQSCSLAKAVILLPVYTAVTWHNTVSSITNVPRVAVLYWLVFSRYRVQVSAQKQAITDDDSLIFPHFL
jgi:hypothetical protein